MRVIMAVHDTRDERFHLELQQIGRVARMRYGVVWAFIFISFARGAYVIATREGLEGVQEGLLRIIFPAAMLAFLGFPLVKYFARKAEDRLRAQFSMAPRRSGGKIRVP